MYTPGCVLNPEYNSVQHQQTLTAFRFEDWSMVDGSVSSARVLAGLLCVGEAWPKEAIFSALGNSVETSAIPDAAGGFLGVMLEYSNAMCTIPHSSPFLWVGWYKPSIWWVVYDIAIPTLYGSMLWCNLQFVFTFCADSGRTANWGWLAGGSAAWISGGQHAGLSIPRFPGDVNSLNVAMYHFDISALIRNSWIFMNINEY